MTNVVTALQAQKLRKNINFNIVSRSTQLNRIKLIIATAAMHIRVTSQERELPKLDDNLTAGIFPYVNINLLSLQNALETLTSTWFC